ncbi:uncharacterized protein LOC141721443 isoform X2 [Apium graveolens]|uniref:uncharacterized protein LOC141721443 isoform X2 n=1 Tax=Apium graveolens TaxID=4045 RepID=UPI003D7C0B30
MLSGLGTVKNLSLDLESILALSEIINNQASVSSPFISLKYLKLPNEYKESSLSSALRSYLLDGCPRATTVTSAAKNNRIYETRAVTVAAENVVLQELLAVPTKEPGDCQYMNKIVIVDTVDMGVQEQDVMETSLVDANSGTQTYPLVGEVSNDLVSSFKGSRDIGLWQGHEVNSDFVCLLDRIMHKYPETFVHFTSKNKKLCTMNLNMLCTSLNDFTKILQDEVDYEIIAQYHDLFAYLQSLGFNLSWVLSHLNYIEHLRFSEPLITELQAIDCRIDVAKTEVQNLQAHVGDAIDNLQSLQTLHTEKMAEIEKKIENFGTNLAVVLIVGDVLSGP